MAGNPYVQAKYNANNELDAWGGRLGVCSTLRQAIRVLNAQANGITIALEGLRTKAQFTDAEKSLVGVNLEAVATSLISDANTLHEYVPPIGSTEFVQKPSTSGLGITCTDLEWQSDDNKESAKFDETHQCLFSDGSTSRIWNSSTVADETASNVGNQNPFAEKAAAATYIQRSRQTGTLANADKDFLNTDGSQNLTYRADYITDKVKLAGLSLKVYAELLDNNWEQFYTDVLGVAVDPGSMDVQMNIYDTEYLTVLSKLKTYVEEQQYHMRDLTTQVNDKGSDALGGILASNVLDHHLTILN
jgi:hypothetical protein